MHLTLTIHVIAMLVITGCLGQVKVWSDEEETTEYWNAKGQDELKIALEREHLNRLTAKNVIMFLGDGMGVPTVTAGRILKGQIHNQTGEEYQLAMEKFPHAGLSKTYSVDRQTTDSAATATAYLCGVKSKHGTIGLTGKVKRRNCESSKGQEVDSILIDAFNEGKSTGIISTVHLVHASPAGAYAHVPERNWYSDTRMSQDALDGGCADIAKQFYKSSNMVTVALSGGRSFFRPNTTQDEVNPLARGERGDGEDFIQQWMDPEHGENRQYVYSKEGLDNVDPISTDKLLGLFQPQSMNFEIDRDPVNEPSLSEMVQKAIEILRKNANGYFLFVEGGKIDHGHHDSSAVEALYDMVAFDDAIDKAVSMTSDADTLIVVTADHSHTMSFGGYAWRGNPILGKTPYDGVSNYKAEDGKPYTSILYNNGPGYQGGLVPVPVQTRENLTGVDTGADNYKQQTGVPRTSESHGGEDVAIFARGPMAHLFHGIHEQSYIPYAMKYAACMGENKGHCTTLVQTTPEETTKTAAKVTTTTKNEFQVQFLNMQLDVTETSVALYTQFVVVLSLACFLLFLVTIFFRSSAKNQSDVTGAYAKNIYTTHSA